MIKKNCVSIDEEKTGKKIAIAIATTNNDDKIDVRYYTCYSLLSHTHARTHSTAQHILFDM